MRISLILISLLLTGSLAFAEDRVYQWTDENGVVIYSNQPPPPGTEAVEKFLKPNPDIGVAVPQSSVPPVNEEGIDSKRAGR